MPIIIKDHEELHDAVLRAALAAGAAAVAGLFLPSTLAAAIMALAVSVAAAPPASVRDAFRLSLAALAGGATLWLPLGWQPYGLALVVGGVVGRKLSIGRGILAMGIAAIGQLAGGAIARALTLSPTLAWLPGGIGVLVAGAVHGAVVGLSSVGRQLKRADPPAQLEEEDEDPALPSVSVPLEGELALLLMRAQRALSEAENAIGQAAPQVKEAARDLLRHMHRFARGWQEVDRAALRSPRSEVEARAVGLKARMLGTTDEVTRSELARAEQAIFAQLEYFDEIDRGRERALARLEHQVATLERLRLAALRHRSVDATRLGAELAPVAEELAQAGAELDIAAESLLEVNVEASCPTPLQPTDRLLS